MMEFEHLIADRLRDRFNVSCITSSTPPYVLFRVKDVTKILQIKYPHSRSSSFDKKYTRVCVTNGGKQSCTFVSLNTIKSIVCTSRKVVSKEVAELLGISLNNIKYDCEEAVFVKIIKQVFQCEEIIEQFQILKFRVDLYFPKYNLIIEIDEKHHRCKSQQVKDIKREKTIKDNLSGCVIMRFKVDEDIHLFLGKVYKYIQYSSFLNTIQDIMDE